MESPHERLRALASTQDGQFASRQARELGLSPDAVRWLRDRGETIALRRGVWRYRAVPGRPDAAVTAYLACWPAAVISHRSAAVRHGLTGPGPPELPEVVVAESCRRAPDGMRVHRTRALPASDVVAAGGVRYTSIARTVCDLAAQRPPWDVLGLLDEAVAGGANPRWIHRRATALVAGRGGVRLLRDATGPDGLAWFRSWLERAAAHVYRVAGIPDPEWNVPVHDRQGLIGVVDALWRPWRVVAEKEGMRFHTTPAQRRGDARRFNRLCEGGYVPRRFGWEDVVYRPVEVAATVHRALRAAGADLDPARIPRRIVVPHLPRPGG